MMNEPKSVLREVVKIIASGLLFTLPAAAQNYGPPVSGFEILDLANSPIAAANTVVPYTASFVASSATSTITFVFRQDPGYFTFDDASVVAANAPTTNLLSNGTFTSGGSDSAGQGAPGWAYFSQNGVTFLGYQENGGGWYDGATGGYDGIDQTFGTVVGDIYNVTFDLSQTYSNDTVYQPTSTNGHSGSAGNGIDVVVYAGNGLPPTSSPEPSTWMMLLAGVVAMALLPLRRRILRG